ncbi:MAG: hypothetical protein CSA81_06085 [Acidobacteria bacterium]|nr:MAG: hypothetical protein CSA81_06085 [Acidobacteriota bacterium]PIE89624.1 MAG: hypothetical protein CR997_10445 [Acidobacteriota bacterium]
MPLKMIVSLIAVLILVSCDNNSKEIRFYHVEKTPVQAQASQPAPTIHWNVPETWQETTASSMHLAAFTAPYEGGEASISIMTLSGDGGGLLLNVNRWLNQLDLKPVEESALVDMAHKMKSESGSFSLFHLANDSKPEKAFLISVYTLPSKTLFIKLIAPAKATEALQPDFEAFCQSIHIH